MKKIFLFIIVITFILSGCIRLNIEEHRVKGFVVYAGTHSLGAVDKNNLENLDQTKFTYSYSLCSDTEKLEEVKEVQPLINENISGLVVSSKITKLVVHVKKKSIETEGHFIFKTKGMTKKQIKELSPYINGFKVIMKDGRKIIAR